MKALEVTNALTYYCIVFITAVKSFMIFAAVQYCSFFSFRNKIITFLHKL